MSDRFKAPIRKLRGSIRQALDYVQLPPAARAERRADLRGLPRADPGPEHAAREGVAWLGRAQDHSATRDGGVARHYSLVDGWGASYPETTGYIVPTMLAYAHHRGGAEGDEARGRARRMLDWFREIQLPGGGFQAGTIGAEPVVPVTFNTGQILMGLAAGVAEFGADYLPATRDAADWLVATQDPDGCWRKNPTPFAGPGIKTYETHVAWGLLEAARACGEARYADAALANVRWALTNQRENGWFEHCCLSDPVRPLTHTIGYTLRGVLEAYRYSHEPGLLAAARRAADGALSALGPDGFLPGRLDRHWGSASRWVCLTGSSQIAHCWLMLYQDTGEGRYREAGLAANRYVRRTMRVEGPPDTRGAVKGSFPVHGGYGTYQYLNWACKFTVDSNLLELALQPAAARP